MFAKNAGYEGRECEFLKNNFEEWIKYLNDDGILQLLYYYCLKVNLVKSIYEQDGSLIYNLLKDEYIILELIPTAINPQKGDIIQLSALKLKGLQLQDRFDERLEEIKGLQKDSIRT